MQDVLAKGILITADAGDHSEANLAALAELERDALIPQVRHARHARDMRARDERFADNDKHKQAPDPLHDKSKPVKASPPYTPQDFQFDREAKACRAVAVNATSAATSP